MSNEEGVWGVTVSYASLGVKHGLGVVQKNFFDFI